MENSFFPLFASILLSLGLGYPAVLLAKRLKLMDVPGSAPHKTHTHPMPLAGGLLIMTTMVLMALLFRQWVTREFLAVFAGTIIVFAFGIWDDRKGLSAGPKLFGQLMASTVLIWSGVQVHFMTIFSDAGYISPSISQILNIVITLIWLIGISNALNMIDSTAGIVTGLGIIASVFFWGVTKLAGQNEMAFWSAALLGLSLGLYFWNNTASKFFLGDSGTQTIGFLLASFGIMYNPLNRSPESSWIVPIMLMGVPIFDTTLVVLSRLKRKQTIGSGRLDHTYHRLIALGLAPKVAVFITHLTAMTISGLAFLTLFLPPFTALTFFLLTLVCGLTLLLWLERKPTLDD